MKISLKWLNELVALPAADEVARRLTMSGLEVEAVHSPGAALTGVVAVKILSSEKHPNAEKLSVTRVSTGAGAPLQIVCGAKNYQVGDTVPLATVGTLLPGAKEPIRAAALRGVESAGMLCSARELGLSEDHGGLLILDPATVPGTPIARVLGLDDVVLELNVTPNRADALSHLGVARDLSALLQRQLCPPKVELAEAGPAVAGKVSIRIEDAGRCWRYAARVVEGVTVKPSPAWVKQRLEACGMRAINNLVDVTNLVMLETGQPLHAFDLDQIGGATIVVRTARPGERLTTLDGKDRALEPEDLLICDAERPLVLAGVMGGESSEVRPTTTRVLLECATFQPVTVRRSARRHGLKTESSHRFERGVDVSAVPAVLDRAAALLVSLAGGTVLPGQVDVYPAVKPAREVTLRLSRVEAVLGVAVPEAECERILGALGFEKLAGSAGESTWRVPPVRVDVAIEEDLIEELARIRGFETIPEVLPHLATEPGPERPRAVLERRIRAALAGQGMDEVVNYSFVSPGELAAFEAGEGAIQVANPISVEQAVMRTTLHASLVPNAVRSVRHQATGVRFYELARTYASRAGGGQGQTPVAEERQQVGGVFWGARDGMSSWSGGEARVDFWDAKAAVEAVLGALHVEGATFEPLASPWYHPRAAAQVVAGGQVLGTLGELHPRARKALDAPEGLFLFQLDVERLEAAAALVPQARALGRYPSVLRDLAVVVESATQASAVAALILQVGQPLVAHARVFDVYTGPQVGEGKKSLAFALTYQAADRTLTDAEVVQAHQRIVTEVAERLGGSLRA
jgi:phenylalanyl-tRNA synthetase beta chain